MSSDVPYFFHFFHSGDPSESGTQSSRRQLQASPPSYVVRCRSAVQLLAAVKLIKGHGSHRKWHQDRQNLHVRWLSKWFKKVQFGTKKPTGEADSLIPGFLIRNFLTLSAGTSDLHPKPWRLSLSVELDRAWREAADPLRRGKLCHSIVSQLVFLLVNLWIPVMLVKQEQTILNFTIGAMNHQNMGGLLLLYYHWTGY